jgi:hypothetical protein
LAPSGGYDELPCQGADPPGIEPGDGPVADAEAPAVQRPPARLQQARADEDRIFARAARRPDHPRPVRQLAQHRQQGRHRATGLLAVARGQHRVGQLPVEGLPSRQQCLECGLIAGQRPRRALGAAPGLGDLDLQPDDDVAAQRLRHPGGEDAAAAERDRAAVGVLEQRHDDLGFAAPELLLAVAVPELADRHLDVAGDQLVDLGRLQARLGCGAQGVGLARPHEPDEDERRLLAHCGNPRRCR